MDWKQIAPKQPCPHVSKQSPLGRGLISQSQDRSRKSVPVTSSGRRHLSSHFTQRQTVTPLYLKGNASGFLDAGISQMFSRSSINVKVMFKSCTHVRTATHKADEDAQVTGVMSDERHDNCDGHTSKSPDILKKKKKKSAELWNIRNLGKRMAENTKSLSTTTAPSMHTKDIILCLLQHSLSSKMKY